MTRTLGGFSSHFADDDGTADPQVREALAAAESGEQVPYLDAVAALCLSRLLVPLVAGGDETLEPDPRREGHMSTALLQRPDGERAVLAFTGVDAMTAWFDRARPVPATLDVVCATARAESASTVLIDLAGPHALVIEGELVTQLADSHRLTRLPDGSFGWLSTREDS